MKKMWQWLPVIGVVFFWFILPTQAQVDGGEAAVPSEFKWPRAIETPQAKIVIYQPQFEDFSDDRLQSRLAASVQRAGKKEPEFGAVWVESRMETDRDERTVRLVAIENVRSRFPNATPEEEQWFADVLKREIPKWDIVLSMDQLIAGLETEQTRVKAEQALNNDPPKILYVNKPAALVLVDGQLSLPYVQYFHPVAIVNSIFGK